MIDTHCHLNDPEAFPDPSAAVSAALSSGIDRLIAIGVDVESSRRAVELASKFEAVYASVGMHPNYTAGYSRADLGEIQSMLALPKVVALGEIGLDFYREHSPREKQYEALNDQLELADRIRKPIVFHCREAYDPLLDILVKRPRGRNTYVFHCFAGDETQASRAYALGGYFGVDGPVSYPSAKELRATLRTLPVDRLLLETDSPYLSPMPHRGKPNRPEYLSFVRDALASTLGITGEECDRITTENACRVFGFG